MPYARAHQVAGSLAGVALLIFGMMGVFIEKQQSPSSFLDRLCRAGFCADEFSVQRVFLLKQESQLPGGAQLVLPLVERALVQNASAYSWSDLGAVELDSGHTQKARYCFQQAVQSAPRNPVILFRAANFDWQAGDPAGTLRILYQVLNNPQLADLYDSAFLTYSRLSVPLETVLAMGVPEQQLPAGRFLHFEMARRNIQVANGVWDWMATHHLITDAVAGEYCQFLADNQRPEAAAEAWHKYAQPDGSYLTTNWVFNGGFEAPPRPSPFDWHIDSTSDVSADRTTAGAYQGTYSLRLQFLGLDNAGYQGAYQLVAVPAGQWHLRAHLKANGLNTTEGVRLHVFEYSVHPSLDAWSDMIAGSTDWQAMDLVFRSGPGARLLRVEPARQPALLFNDRVRGTVWIDDVELTPEGASEQAAR